MSDAEQAFGLGTYVQIDVQCIIYLPHSASYLSDV